MSEWEPQQMRVTLTNRHGLHARPAHLFVQTANAWFTCYNAKTGEILWNKTNIGQKHDNGLMQVQHDAMDELFALLDAPAVY